MRNTAERRKQVPALVARGFSERAIASMFGVTRGAIWQDKNVLGIKCEGEKKTEEEIQQELARIRQGRQDLWNLANFGHLKK